MPDGFSYRAHKDGAVALYWRGREVRTVRGRAAASLLAKVKEADPREAQLLLAKATGNFKRGNERQPDRIE